jgi:hypothetical protein
MNSVASSAGHIIFLNIDPSTWWHAGAFVNFDWNSTVFLQDITVRSCLMLLFHSNTKIQHLVALEVSLQI